MHRPHDSRSRDASRRASPFRAHARTWVLSAALLLSACAGGGSSGATSDADTSRPRPIVAPPDTWTFVPIDGARCADGSATGIGVRLVPGSRELFIYMEGGGACSTGDVCWGDAPGGAANLNGYGAADFAAEPKLRGYAYFETREGTANPFARMNMAMVPYCTGDIHGGSIVRELQVGSTTRTTHFVGARNLQLALDRLAATFPTLDSVWLLGTSAGGAGVTINYARIRATLRATVHAVVDSAPGFSEERDAEKWSVWGLATPCAGCASAADVRRFNRSLDPASRYAFLSFRFDATTAQSTWTEAEFDAQLQALVAEIQADPNARTFVVDNSSTGLGPPTQHVVTTKNAVPLREQHVGFVAAMVADSGWNNTVVPAP